MVQSKGQISFVYGAEIPAVIKGLAENAITYDLGELGDTLSSLTDVVHIIKSKGSVVSTITINCLKGVDGLGALTSLIQSGIPLPLTVNDGSMGIKVFMSSANATQVQIGESNGGNSVETVSFVFKGNITLLDM